MEDFKFSTIEEAVEDFKQGKFVIVVEDSKKLRQIIFLVNVCLLWIFILFLCHY